MEIETIKQLSALAHPNRLAIFRLLMRRYPQAVPAGEIATQLGIKANTGSVYFAALRDAGLIDQERVGTSLKYKVNIAHLRSMFGYLLDECCQSRPDICAPFAPAKLVQAQRAMTVLFICTGNSARSIMAEALLRDEGGDAFIVYSAGTHPSSGPHPQVLDLLHSKGHATRGLASKNIDLFSGSNTADFDFVFTVCDQAANEDCPAWPGQPISAHWGLPDPVKAQGTEAELKLAFQQTYGLLKNRIKAFVSLPFETLDRISLQHHVDDIGQMPEDTEMS